MVEFLQPMSSKECLAAARHGLSSDGEWLLSTRLMANKHAEHEGYESPQLHENVTADGKRRVWWLSGRGEKLQVVQENDGFQQAA